MKKQAGVTLIGFLFMLIIAGFFALMAMRLVPAYIEFGGVVKAMNQIANEPGSAQKSVSEIRGDLAFKGSFQYVDDATLGANSQAVKVERKNGQTTLSVNYDKKIPFLYNIDFLVHFQKTVALKGNVG
ncbi:MAG TPA: DUF4845 domain-containing protein [Rhodanobacteraceae bacterium]|nr:DUF4845 domain-containing protein [Rhodanobacteraceae bacterium]